MKECIPLRYIPPLKTYLLPSPGGEIRWGKTSMKGFPLTLILSRRERGLGIELSNQSDSDRQHFQKKSTQFPVNQIQGPKSLHPWTLLHLSGILFVRPGNAYIPGKWYSIHSMMGAGTKVHPSKKIPHPTPLPEGRGEGMRDYTQFISQFIMNTARYGWILPCFLFIGGFRSAQSTLHFHKLRYDG